jgi:heme-degrading monooxygenase HmoA
VAVIVVTRLRLKDAALLDEFFTDAVAALEQAQKSEGNLGVNALADANNAWWSVSSWRARDPMRAFVNSEPHLSITARLDHYCDEATFVDWEQDSPDLPDWQTSWRHITAVGGQPDPRLPPAGRARRRPLTADRRPRVCWPAGVPGNYPWRRKPRPVARCRLSP